MQKRITTTLLQHQPPKTLHKLIACLIVLMGSNTLLANPTNGNVSSGSADITANGSTLTIHQLTPNTTIQWQTFSIQNGETVTFAQPSASSVAVNRVTGGDASQILGTLSANGQVFLINPNGFLFGNNAIVNTAGLVATTLDLTQADFATGHYTFSGTAGSVSNAGKLNSPNGYVVLMGNHLNNTGTITTTNGTSALIAGSTVTLGVQPGSPLTYKIDAGTLNALIENHGAILADKGTIMLDASAANGLTGGVINVDGLISGQLLSVGSNTTITNSGTINLLSGNTILPINGTNATLTGTTTNLNGNGLNISSGNIQTGSTVSLGSGGTVPVSSGQSGTLSINGNGHVVTTDTSTLFSNSSSTQNTNPIVVSSGNANNGSGSHKVSATQTSTTVPNKSGAMTLSYGSAATVSGIVTTQAVTPNHGTSETTVHDAIQAATSVTQP